MSNPQLIRSAMKQKLKKEAEWKELAKVVRKRLKDNFYEHWIRVFIDKPDPVKYSLEETSAFMLCWSALLSNKIAATRIVMGAKPSLDNPNWNAILLAKPSDDTGIYYGGMSGEANYHIGWKKPLVFAVNEVTTIEVNEGHTLLPPMKASLQVGHIDVFDILAMLSAWRHVARWPSDSENITVLQVLDPSLWSLISTLDIEAIVRQEAEE